MPACALPLAGFLRCMHGENAPLGTPVHHRAVRVKLLEFPFNINWLGENAPMAPLEPPFLKRKNIRA